MIRVIWERGADDHATPGSAPYLPAWEATFHSRVTVGYAFCAARAEGKLWICTRDPHHAGPHIAHGVTHRVLMVWMDHCPQRESS